MTVAIESRARAEKVADYTFAALAERDGDAFYGPRYLIYEPIYEAMKAERTVYGTQKGAQKGKTVSLDDLLKELSPAKINAWNIKISNVYAPGTAEYVALLPNGHAPFGTGKKDNRIEAVKDLGQALEDIVALAAVKTEVDDFYDALKEARVGQKGSISTTKDDSEELTDAMMECMVALYSLLGACIEKFAATPEDIKPIFDISTIRDVAQTLFIHTVKKGDGTTTFVFKRTLKPERKIRITVLSPHALVFGITDEKNDPIGEKQVTVEGMEEEVITSAIIKASDTAAFFKVRNTDDDVDGHFKIELL